MSGEDWSWTTTDARGFASNWEAILPDSSGASAAGASSGSASSFDVNSATITNAAAGASAGPASATPARSFTEHDWDPLPSSSGASAGLASANNYGSNWEAVLSGSSGTAAGASANNYGSNWASPATGARSSAEAVMATITPGHTAPDRDDPRMLILVEYGKARRTEQLISGIVGEFFYSGDAISTFDRSAGEIIVHNVGFYRLSETRKDYHTMLLRIEYTNDEIYYNSHRHLKRVVGSIEYHSIRGFIVFDLDIPAYNISHARHKELLIEWVARLFAQTHISEVQLLYNAKFDFMEKLETNPTGALMINNGPRGDHVRYCFDPSKPPATIEAPRRIDIFNLIETAPCAVYSNSNKIR